MMPDLAQIYDTAFFEEWGKKNEKYVRSAEKIVEIICRIHKPKRIVDLGCGCAVYPHFFKKHGVDSVAIDGVLPPKDESFDVPIELQDITVPFENKWGKFDLAICFEVAEHIPEEFSEQFLKNLLQFSDTILLSGAPIDQGGHHHVNEQPKRYWIDRMKKLGYLYNRKRTGTIMEIFKVEKPGFMWMCEQISVYEKEGTGEPPKLRKKSPPRSYNAGSNPSSP